MTVCVRKYTHIYGYLIKEQSTYSCVVAYSQHGHILLKNSCMHAVICFAGCIITGLSLQN